MTGPERRWCSRWGMRPLAIGAACVLTGAAIATTVAWGIGLWGALADFTVKIQQGAHSDLILRAQAFSPNDLARCNELIPDITSATYVWLGIGTGVGLRDVRISAEVRRTASYVMVHQTGWPLCAFEYRYEGAPAPSWPGRPSGWRAPDWLVREAYTNVAWDRTGRPPVPLRPIPVGLALDTAFYAAALAATYPMFAASRSLLIRQRRRRCGLCPACAYPRAGLAPSAPCPECGQAQRNAEQARASST